VTEENPSDRFSFSFEKKNLLSAFAVLLIGAALFASGGIAQTSSDTSVSIGSNGIQIFSGVLDMNGQDIEDSGTTIWDAGAGQIATAVVDYSAATASDVGLGNVLNKEQLAVDGTNSMNANLEMSENAISNSSLIQVIGSGSNSIEIRVKNDNLNENKIQWSKDGTSVDSFISVADVVDAGALEGSSITDDMIISSEDDIQLRVNRNGSSCTINDQADLNCDGSKNWVQDLDNGSEAVYTSQESPQVRAVYEGKADVVDSKKIKLPKHFSMTVSDSKPMLRAQVTPQGTFTKAVVMDKTEDYIEIKVGEQTDVNFRITGIREGYEDKQVVRPKEE
jgi:hypothetical protein